MYKIHTFLSHKHTYTMYVYVCYTSCVFCIIYSGLGIFGDCGHADERETNTCTRITDGLILRIWGFIAIFIQLPDTYFLFQGCWRCMGGNVENFKDTSLILIPCGAVNLV